MQHKDQKEPMPRPQLDRDQVKEICEDIELQWERHLLTRFFFNSKFPQYDSYSSFQFSYYAKLGNIEVKLPPLNDRTEIFKRASREIGNWHNQNFVIRLSGIVNKHRILAYGKQEGEDIIVLLDKMRNNVGAPQSGTSIPDKSPFLQCLRLIEKLFNKEFDKELRHYPLVIDEVLEPLKNGVKKYIETLVV